MTTAMLSTVPATRLRLTKRGRMVLTGLVAVPMALMLGFSALSSGPAAAGNSAGNAVLQSVTVQSGQSLWSIAESIAPNRDPRDVIAEIIKLNGLDSAEVPAGITLSLPSF